MEVKCHAWPYLAGGKDRKISDMIKKDFYPEHSDKEVDLSFDSPNYLYSEPIKPIGEDFKHLQS